MKRFIAILLFGMTLQQTAWSNEITLRVGNQNIQTKVANTPLSRANGLMNITQLCENCGMLFVFKTLGNYTFWMKDTPLSLSIAFIAADGRILNISEMQAYTLNMHSSQDASLYALEMNKGWFAAHAIKPRDYVQGLQKVRKGE